MTDISMGARQAQRKRYADLQPQMRDAVDHSVEAVKEIMRAGMQAGCISSSSVEVGEPSTCCVDMMRRAVVIPVNNLHYQDMSKLLAYLKTKLGDDVVLSAGSAQRGHIGSYMLSKSLVVGGGTGGGSRFLGFVRSVIGACLLLVGAWFIWVALRPAGAESRRH